MSSFSWYLRMFLTEKVKSIFDSRDMGFLG